MYGGSDEEVGGQDSGSERREGKSNKDARRILDVCPAIVMLPNPLLDLRAARAAETTVGGFGMLESFTTKGTKKNKTTTAMMKKQVIISSGYYQIILQVMHFTQHSARLCSQISSQRHEIKIICQSTSSQIVDLTVEL